MTVEDINDVNHFVELCLFLYLSSGCFPHSKILFDFDTSCVTAPCNIRCCSSGMRKVNLRCTELVSKETCGK